MLDALAALALLLATMLVLGLGYMLIAAMVDSMTVREARRRANRRKGFIT